MKKILKFIAGIPSIAAIVFIVYLFTFSIDGEMGVILIAFMLIAPLVSLIFALYARKRINVSFDCDSYVKKGSELKVRVKLRKTGFFPLAVVELRPEASEVFEKQDKIYRLSMCSDKTTEFELSFRAVIGGNGSVYISDVYSCGFLGFMKFRVKTTLPEPFSVGVIPDIPEIKESSQFFRSIADAVMTSDEDENNDTSMIFSANTAPGYEHREYVQGDPLKRVNWKLSSKKNKLMVRLDEATASVQPLIVLDLYRKKGADPKYAVITEEKLIRSVFGLLMLLVKRGIACNFAYYSASGELVTESIDNPDIPEQTLLKILSVRVTEGRRIDFGKLDSSVCAFVVATTDAGPKFSGIIRKTDESDNMCILGISAESANASGLPLWYLDENNTFKLV